MSEREAFNGLAINAIDGKGRVAVPAPMRAVIEKNVERFGGDARTVVIAMHPKDPCLIGYDPAWLKLNHDKLEQQEELRVSNGGDVDFNIKRRALGLTESAQFDSSGRFILPDFFAMKAKLDTGGDAVFYGTGNFFEIWSPEVLIATPGVDPDLKEAVAYRLSKRTAK